MESNIDNHWQGVGGCQRQRSSHKMNTSAGYEHVSQLCVIALCENADGEGLISDLS